MYAHSTILVSFRKTAKADYCLRAVCLFAWNNSALTGQIFMKFDI
jgi:hypothetical protein